MKRASRLAFLALLAAPAAALGHGGDDHGDKPAVTGGAERPPAAGGTGDLFEVVVKYAPAAPGKPTALRVFVADAATNEPVSGAEIELTFSASSEIKVIPKAADAPGVYLGSVVFASEGEVDAVASVSRGDDADLVTLGPVRSGLPPASAIPPHDHPSVLRSHPILAAGAAAVAVGFGAIALVIRAARARSRRQEVEGG